jgi:integrase
MDKSSKDESRIYKHKDGHQTAFFSLDKGRWRKTFYRIGEGTSDTSQRFIQLSRGNMSDLHNDDRQTGTLFLLTPEQARRFLEAAKDDRLEALYVLALTTGMRRSELLALKWEDIDFCLKRIQVRRTITRVPGEGLKMSEPKTARSLREIPLMSLALEALERHRIWQLEAKQRGGTAWNDQELVFCNTRGHPIVITTLLTRSFHPLLIKAELPSIRFHDVRNGTAVLLIASGVQVQVVADLLGYSLPLNMLLPISLSMREEAIVCLEAVLTRYD